MGVYERTIDELKSLSEESFRSFSDKILASDKPLIGVRTSAIKAIAKRISKNNPTEYICECKFGYYEDTLLYGLVIATLSKDDFFKYLPTYLERCASWAHVDMFVPAIKFVRNDKSELFDYVEKHIMTDEGFYLRFCIIVLMDYFLPEKLNYILKMLEKIDGKGYYNDMAIAWLLSVAFIKSRDETFEYLNGDKLSKFTHNKTISKISDSFRVSAEDKELVKRLVRK